MRVALLAILVAACGDSGAPAIIDSSPTADAPYDQTRCLIAGFYGALGMKTGSTAQGAGTSTIVLDAGPPRDSFFLKLNTGKGVFAGGVTTGTFTLAGADLGFNTCGACLNIVADVGTVGPAKFYFATGGMLTLTAANPPAGSIANVTFAEVMASGAVVQDGCIARIDSMTFTTQ